MKTLTIPVMILASAISFGVSAARASEPQASAEQQADKAPATKVQPHSHLQEKTGMTPQKKAARATKDREQDTGSTELEKGEPSTQKPKSTATKSSKVRADKDKTKHYHPRDGK